MSAYCGIVASLFRFAAPLWEGVSRRSYRKQRRVPTEAEATFTEGH